MSARFRFALAIVVLFAGFVPGSGAQSGGAHRFVQAPASGEFVPAIQLGHRPEMTVVLKMAGDPVAVVRGRAPSKQLAEADEKVIENALRTQQEALIPAIEAQGATVLGKFQYAINGIKVRATADQIASLARLPGVVAVKPVLTYRVNNATSVPFIGTPAVWQGPPGLHGEHIKLAIIDTGVDFTHANFAGPGTVGAFKAAFAADTLPADPMFFGPKAPKVKGGTDLVGDNYDASSSDPAKNTPVPDPNPMDCNGHGSHVSGTAAGFGVLSNGTTFKGPYDATTPSQSFTIGPGVAPLADLYMVKVFGCAGSTNVVVEAFDWVIKNHMQIASLSLGADFGSEGTADAEAAEHAVESGVVVVAASGNAGFAPYITSTPASGDKVISVAAMDRTASFAGATLKLSPSGKSIVAQNSNGATFTDGTSLQVVVLPDNKGSGAAGVSLGCDPAEYSAAQVSGKLVVVQRGTCARVARAIFGQQAGAAAVAMINNASGYPPIEGPITVNPDTGIPFTVTIPFLGIRGPSAASGDGAALKAASSATLTNSTIANPGFRTIVSFSSGGPRLEDGHLKPDITAPGLNITSTGIGTGNGPLTISGTSMATPHVSGTAALALQAHPGWDAFNVSTAVVNTADSTQLLNYSPRLGGAGLVQPLPATRTSVIARGYQESTSANFGVREFTSDFHGEQEITVNNLGSGSESFTVSAQAATDSSPHTVTVHPTSLTLGGGDSATLHLKLVVPAATVGDSSDFRQVTGLVTLKPTNSSQNGGASVTVPYYLVARARSQVEVGQRNWLQQQFGPSHPKTTVVLGNESGAVPGTGDFYAWGLEGEDKGLGSIGLRAVGVQSFDFGPPFGQGMAFAVNTFARWSNAATDEFDVLIYNNGHTTPDFAVSALDLGLVTTGLFNGQVVSVVTNLHTGRAVIRFFAIAPTDGTTLLLPVVASDIGATAANPRFAYSAQSFDLLGTASDAIAGPAQFNAFNNSISTAAFATVAPHGTAKVPLTLDPAEFKLTPALGVMIVALENANGTGEAGSPLEFEEGQQAFLLPADNE